MIWSKLQRPYVESYWESWRSWSDFPDDFAAFLKDVPASPIGSCQGVNVVNIAFGDYNQGISGHEATDEILIEGITAIHDKVVDMSQCVSGYKIDMLLSVIISGWVRQDSARWSNVFHVQSYPLSWGCCEVCWDIVTGCHQISSWWCRSWCGR